MTRVWDYGGNKYYFDVSERASVEKITRALRDLTKSSDDVEDLIDAGELIFRHCEMIEAFFDTVLGDGAGRVICGNTESAEAYSAAYASFILFVRSEVEAFSEIGRNMDRALQTKSRTEQ